MATINAQREWKVIESGKVVCGNATVMVSQRREDFGGKRVQVSLVVNAEWAVHDAFPSVGEVRATVQAIVAARNLPPLSDNALFALEYHAQS